VIQSGPDNSSGKLFLPYCKTKTFVCTVPEIWSYGLRTLVTLHLLQSHCTRGLQYPKQSDWRLTGSSKAAGRFLHWVSFDFHVAYSSRWGYSLINTLKLKKKLDNASDILSKMNKSCPVDVPCQSNANLGGTGPSLAICCHPFRGESVDCVKTNSKVHRNIAHTYLIRGSFWHIIIILLANLWQAQHVHRARRVWWQAWVVYTLSVTV